MKSLLKLSLGLMLFAAFSLSLCAQGEKPILKEKGKRAIPCDEIVSVDPSTGDVTYKNGSSTSKLAGANVQYVFAPLSQCKELGQAEKMFQQGQYGEAYSQLQKCSRYAKMGWDARIASLSAQCALALKRPQDAVKAAEVALKIKAEGDAAWKKADLTQALTALAIGAAQVKNKAVMDNAARLALMSNDKDAHAKICYAQGEYFVTEGKYQDAFFKYAMAALVYPDTSIEPMALCQSANMLKMLKDSRSKKFEDILKAKYPNDPAVKALK